MKDGTVSAQIVWNDRPDAGPDVTVSVFIVELDSTDTARVKSLEPRGITYAEGELTPSSYDLAYLYCQSAARQRGAKIVMLLTEEIADPNDNVFHFAVESQDSDPKDK